MDGGVEGDDYAADVLVDGAGNIIICGTSEVSASNFNAVVVKYNSSGTLQWASSFARGANLHDGFVSLERDNSNNIYVCGATLTTTEFSNYLIVKYNSSGTQQWASAYDYNDLNDTSVKLVITSTYILESGGTQVNATDWQMTSVKYHPCTGAQGSVLHKGGDGEGIDEVKDVWTDGTYTYVVGGVNNVGWVNNMVMGFDWKLMKLNSDL